MSDMIWKKNQEIVLYIDDYSSQGEGIGHINGYSFFIKGAVKGEKIRAAVTKVKKNYSYARIIEILKSSDYRTEPECSYYNKCGGCQLQHISYAGQLEFKRTKIDNVLKKISGLDIKLDKIIAADESYRYRNKAQYPVGKDEKDNSMITGFYSARSHKIINIDDCILEPEINSMLLNAVTDFCSKNKISIYDETTHTGLLRNIMIRHGYNTNEFMLCLIINAKSYDKERFLGCYAEINNKLKIYNEENGVNYEFAALLLNYNNKKTNVVLGENTDVISGRAYIIDEMNGIKYAISANSFYQVNQVQAEKLYRLVEELAEPTKSDIIFDMYCGIGTIGLYLARKSRYVYGVEIVKEAIEMANYNKELNNIENAQFFAGSADDMTELLFKERNIIPDIIVVDPPRKGCTGDMLDIMLNIKPTKIVYVSCEPSTLARDLKLLCSTGEYEVKKVIGVDQFCQTFHVETIVLLSRIND